MQKRDMSTLQANVRDILGFRGPQPVQWLEKLLNVGRTEIMHTSFLCTSSIGRSRTHTSFNLSDLFPNIQRPTVYYLTGQEVELGLLFGREWLAGERTKGRMMSFRTAMQKVFDTRLQSPDGSFAIRAHYCNTGARVSDLTYYVFQGTRYTISGSREWPPRAQYVLERVHENRRQHREIKEIDKLRGEFLSDGFAPAYEVLAAKLGWTKPYAAKYHRLAAAAQMPRKVYVLGGGWSRLFDFGKAIDVK